jgi:hypothetical protein
MMTVPWLGGTGLWGVKLYHLEELAAVLLIAVILVAAIAVLLLPGIFFWKAVVNGIRWATRRIAKAKRRRFLMPHTLVTRKL